MSLYKKIEIYNGDQVEWHRIGRYFEDASTGVRSVDVFSYQTYNDMFSFSSPDARTNIPYNSTKSSDRESAYSAILSFGDFAGSTIYEDGIY